MIDNLARQHRRSGVIFMSAGVWGNLFKGLNREGNIAVNDVLTSHFVGFLQVAFVDQK